MTVGELIAKLTLDKSGYDAGLSDAQKKASQFGSNISNIGKSMSMALTAPIVAFAGFSIKAWTESEQAAAKLSGTLKATGNSIGYTTSQLTGFASEIQSMTTYEDDAIVNAEALMTTFTAIGHDVFPEAIKAAVDMSAVMGTDLNGSVIQLGKALQDPITGLTALRRVGVNFNETQKETIKNFVQMGDTVSAQNVILAELQKEFGGVAQAMAQTDSGALKQLGNDFGDLQEDIGRLILQSLRPLIDGAREVIKWFMGLDENTKRVIITIGGVAAAVGPLMVVLGALFKMIATNPVGIIVTAVAALAAGIAVAVSTMKSEEQKAAEDYAKFKEQVAKEDEESSNKRIANQKRLYELGLKSEKEIFDMEQRTLKIRQENFKNGSMSLDQVRTKEKEIAELKEYFANKEDEKKSEQLIKDKKAQEENKELWKQFQIEKLSDIEKETKALDEQYKKYRAAGVNKNELDKWYAREKNELLEKNTKKEEETSNSIQEIYDAQTQAKLDNIKEELRAQEEASQKQKELIQAIVDTASLSYDMLKGAVGSYFEYLKSELEAQVDREAEVAEEFENANKSEFEKELDRIEYAKAKYIAAGISKEKADAWAQKEIEKIKDKATDEELANINSITANSEQANALKYNSERELAMKKYKLEVDAFNANKAFNIASIIINTATAIMKAYTDLGPIGGTIAAVIIGVLGGIQVASVAGQQPPPPPAYQFGGWIGGQGGVDNNVIRASRGEFVVNSEAAAENADTLERINSGRTGGSSVQPVTILVQTSEGRIIGQADLDFMWNESKNGNPIIHPRGVRANA